jgi:hypothetical protein
MEGYNSCTSHSWIYAVVFPVPLQFVLPFPLEQISPLPNSPSGVSLSLGQINQGMAVREPTQQ